MQRAKLQIAAANSISIIDTGTVVVKHYGCVALTSCMKMLVSSVCRNSTPEYCSWQ